MTRTRRSCGSVHDGRSRELGQAVVERNAGTAVAAFSTLRRVHLVIHAPSKPRTLPYIDTLKRIPIVRGRAQLTVSPGWNGA